MAPVSRFPLSQPEPWRGDWGQFYPLSDWGILRAIRDADCLGKGDAIEIAAGQWDRLTKPSSKIIPVVCVVPYGARQAVEDEGTEIRRRHAVVRRRR